jgi:hypothetical protein
MSQSIDRELLATVVGGDWVTNAIDFVGPAVGRFYGQDWKTAPCITRANLGAEAVGITSKIVTTVGGYYLGAKAGGGHASGLGGAIIGELGGDVSRSWLRENVRARYMQTCNLK